MAGIARNAIRRVAPIFLLIAFWQITASFGTRESALIPSPAQVAQAIGEMSASGELFQDCLASLRRVLFGFALAAVAGCAGGATVAWLGKNGYWLDVPLEMLRPIPPIAWIPLAILWFGIGEIPAYFIVFLGALFPIFVNVLSGIRTTELLHLNAARYLGADRRLILTDIVWPSALPNILTGLRIGFGVGWICVITAEMVGAQSGLGYMIQLNRLLLRTDKVVAGMVVIGCLGYFCNQLLVLLEGRLVRWRTPSALA